MSGVARKLDADESQQWEIAFDLSRRVPVHETGHAVVALALGIPVHRVTVDNDFRGLTVNGNPKRRRRRDGGVYLPHPSDFNHIRRHMALCFGGFVAERRAFPENRRRALGGAKEDFDEIERWNPFLHWNRSWHGGQHRALAFEEALTLDVETDGYDGSELWKTQMVLPSLRLAHRIVSRSSEALDELAERLQDWNEAGDGRWFAGFARRHRLRVIGREVEESIARRPSL